MLENFASLLMGFQVVFDPQNIGACEMCIRDSPSIVVICFVGAFSTSNSMFGVVVMMIGGILGYIFKKNDIPVSPLLLAFVLSSTLETNVRRTFIASQGSLRLFYTRPITLVLVLVFLAIVGTPLVKAIIKKGKNKNVQEEEVK